MLGRRIAGSRGNSIPRLVTTRGRSSTSRKVPPTAATLGVHSAESTSQLFAGTPMHQARSYCNNNNNTIDVADISFVEEDDVHFDGNSSTQTGEKDGESESRGSPLGRFVDVDEIDTFARARVMNFIKRSLSATDKAAAKDKELFETREVRHAASSSGNVETALSTSVMSSGSDGQAADNDGTITHYHTKIKIPLPAEYGERYGEGYACNVKDAEMLAIMHAERTIDALGFQIYTLSSMQKKHVVAAVKAGRWAPQPNDARKGPETPSPRPLRRVIFHDESEGGAWALIDVVPQQQQHLQTPPHTIFSPAVIDIHASGRIRGFFHHLGASFDQHLKLKDAVKATHTDPPQLLATLRLPVPDQFGHVVAEAKANDRHTAVLLCCMHAELILDAIGMPLFQTDEMQNEHAKAARGFGRKAPMAGEPLAEPGTVLMPLPFKQLNCTDSTTGKKQRHVGLSFDEDLLLRNQLISSDCSAHVDVVVEKDGEGDSREALSAFLAARGFPRSNPYFTERVAATYRSTVYLPLPAMYGTRGGVGMGSTVEEAQTLAAQHAVDVLNHLGITPYENSVEKQREHEQKRKALGLVVASEVVDGSSKSVAESSPAAFRQAKKQAATTTTRAEGVEEVDNSPEARKKRRAAMLNQMCGGQQAPQQQETTADTKPPETADSTQQQQPQGKKEDIHKDKFDFLAKRARAEKANWSFEADMEDGFILVRPSADRTSSASFGHTQASPRSYDDQAKRRFVKYLQGCGKRFETIVKFETFTTPRDGLNWHRAVAQLPVPQRFGPRIAVGEAPSQVEAENLLAMHAELVLDTLGIPLYLDEYSQRRHAHAARIQGRFAPLPDATMEQELEALLQTSASTNDLLFTDAKRHLMMLKDSPAEVMSPPPLRKERLDSSNWANLVKSGRATPTGSAEVGGAASSSKPVGSDPDDWKTAEYQSITNATKIDMNSKARVQNYQRRVKSTDDVITVGHHVAAEGIHVSKLRLQVPERFGTRYAMGVAPTKKDAENLCYMHAERVIDALGIQLFNMAGLQKRHVDRVKKEGRWAPSFGDKTEKLGTTPSPLPMKLVEKGSAIDATLNSAAVKIPVPPEDFVMFRDTKAWNKFVKDSENFIADAKAAKEMEAYVNDKVPRTGDKLFDETLDEVEGAAINPNIKMELYEYCARTGYTYPTFWKTRQVGTQRTRKSFTSVEVPGFEHIEAFGIGNNKETSQRRAAMHVFALLRRLDPDFAVQEQSLAGAGTKSASESAQQSKYTAKFKGSYDRNTQSFTQEGMTRLVELYTVCTGIDPPRITHTQRKEGNFIVQSTAVEITDPTGRVYSGRAREGGTSVNEPAAYENLFHTLWRNVPGFSALGDLVKTHPHLDPEHVVNLSLDPAIQDRIEEILSNGNTSLAVDENAPEMELDHTVDQTTQQLVDATDETSQEAHREQQSQVLKARMQSKLGDEIYKERFADRRNTLSIAEHKQEILDTIQNNSITVLCGTTGCGKTTQVPQYILDDMTERDQGGNCNIIVTQPRRISAVSISERIADERREQLGEAVGYTIRLDSKPGRHINFCTSGVLLRIFQAKPQLDGITHVIIDEIHERDINSDFLLILLRDLAFRRPDIRIVLMSATLQSDQFSSYFNGAPVINVEGRVFPVKDIFLDDLAKIAGELSVPLTPSMKDLAANDANMENANNEDDDGHDNSYRNQQNQNVGLIEVRTDIDYGALVFAVEHIRKTTDLENSSILVFLPGWDEITKARDHIVQTAPLRYHIITLHSSVSKEEQMQCFKAPPLGKVKLILSTNIAESGVTIDDIAAVIDVGRAKEKSFVMKRGRTAVSRKELGGMSQLVTVHASRANCTQRRGRAGRTREGTVVRMYTRRHLELVPDFQTPEILRQPLDSLCLQILSLGLGDPNDFLQKALEPPSPENIQSAMVRLFDLGAISTNGKLTPLGLRLSQLPVAPRVGKMVILGAMFRCLDSALTMAATTNMDVFVSAREQRDVVRVQREEASLNSLSDQLASLNAFNLWATANAEKTQNDVLLLLQGYVLNPQSLMLVSKYKRQFYDILVTSGFIPTKRFAPKTPIFIDDGGYSKDAQDIGLVKTVLCASLFPNVAINRGKRLMRNKFDNVIAPSSASVIHRTSQEDIENPFFVFEEMSKSPEGKTSLRGLTNVSLWSILLLGASNTHMSFEENLTLGVIDDWVLFRANAETLDIVRRLKQRIDMLITRKLVEPEDITITEELDKIQAIIKELVGTPLRPNSLVEEPWEEKGVISQPTPLPESMYNNHFISALPSAASSAASAGAEASAAASGTTNTASSEAVAAAMAEGEHEALSSAEKFLQDLNNTEAVMDGGEGGDDDDEGLNFNA